MAMASSTTDYLVIGAGAMGMAFTDALIDHADVHVTLVDRRHGAGGHWQDAYPFVQLHQASVFYGVASTVLGSGAVQPSGPEAGLQERARQSGIQAYYDDILERRFIGSGRVTFLGGSEYHMDGASTEHGRRHAVEQRRLMKLDERVRVLPMPAGCMAAVDERDMHVRVIDQCICEGHAHGARTHDQVVGLQRSHRHAGMASGVNGEDGRTILRGAAGRRRHRQRPSQRLRAVRGVL